MNSNLKKYQYNDNQLNPVVLLEYMIMKDENNDKFILFEFKNNYKKTLMAIEYEIDEIDKDGNVCNTFKYEYSNFSCKKKKLFVPYNKMFIKNECVGIQVRLIKAEFEGKLYMNNEFMSVKNTKKTKIKAAKKATKVRNVTKKQTFRFAFIALIVLICSVGFSIFVLFDIKNKLNEAGSFTTNGIVYEIFEKGKSVKVLSLEDKALKDTNAVKDSTSGTKTISIPERVSGFAVKGIKQNAISKSQKKVLESVTISSGIFDIEDEVFSDCEVLTTITARNTTLGLGKNAFNNCTKLTDVSFKNLGDVKESPFNNTPYAESNTITTLSCGILYNNSLTVFKNLASLDYQDSASPKFGSIFNNNVPTTLDSVTTSQVNIDYNYFDGYRSSFILTLKCNNNTGLYPKVEWDSLKDFKGFEGTTSRQLFNDMVVCYKDLNNVVIEDTNISNNIFNNITEIETLELKKSVDLKSIYVGKIKNLIIDEKPLSKLDEAYEITNLEAKTKLSDVINGAKITNVIMYSSIAANDINSIKNLCKAVIKDSSVKIDSSYNIATVELDYSYFSSIKNDNNKIKTIVLVNCDNVYESDFTYFKNLENLVFSNTTPKFNTNSLKSLDSLVYLFTPKAPNIEKSGVDSANITLICNDFVSDTSIFKKVIKDPYDPTRKYYLTHDNNNYIYTGFILAGINEYLNTENYVFYADNSLITSYYGSSWVNERKSKNITVKIIEYPVITYNDYATTTIISDEVSSYQYLKKTDSKQFAGWKTKDGEFIDFKNTIDRDLDLVPLLVDDSCLAGYNPSMTISDTKITFYSLLTSSVTVSISNPNATFDFGGVKSTNGSVTTNVKAGEVYQINISSNEAKESISVIYKEKLPEVKTKLTEKVINTASGSRVNIDLSTKKEGFMGYGANGITYINKNGICVVPFEDNIELKAIYK